MKIDIEDIIKEDHIELIRKDFGDYRKGYVEYDKDTQKDIMEELHRAVDWSIKRLDKSIKKLNKLHTIKE